MGVCGIFRPPVQGGSNELISKFLSSMTLYNHPSYFKSGEVNSCRLSPLPTLRVLKPKLVFGTILKMILLALKWHQHFTDWMFGCNAMTKSGQGLVCIMKKWFWENSVWSHRIVCTFSHREGIFNFNVCTFFYDCDVGTWLSPSNTP